MSSEEQPQKGWLGLDLEKPIGTHQEMWWKPLTAETVWSSTPTHYDSLRMKRLLVVPIVWIHTLRKERVEVLSGDLC